MSSMTHGNEKIAEALRLLEETASERRADLASLLADKYGALKTVIRESENALSQAFGEGKARAVEAATSAKAYCVEKAERVDEHVHEKPWQYIGGAAVAGVLLGYLLGRRNGR